MADGKKLDPSKHGFRQEVFNVLLAQLLQERKIISAPEEILSSPAGRKMPDVLVEYLGLRTVIEGEVADQANAAEKALASGSKRIEDGIAHIALAVVYPENLRTTPFSELKPTLENSRLQAAVITEAGASGYGETNVDGLADFLRRAFEQLVQEDVVGQAVAVLEEGIEKFAAAVAGSPGIVSRIAEAMGVRELPKKEVEEEE